MLSSGGDLSLVDRERWLARNDFVARPTIFQQAIAAGDDYDEQMIQWLVREGAGPMTIYESLAAKDIFSSCL